MFYLAGSGFGILSIFWFFTPFHEIFTFAIRASTTFLVFGLISDLLIIYKVVWNTVIGKGCLLLTYAFCTNATYAIATRIVNEVVKFDASTLTYTVNLVAVLLAPALILIGTCVALGIILALGQFYLMLTMYSNTLQKNKCLSKLLPQPTEEYPGITFTIRTVAVFATLITLSPFVSRTPPSYIKFIEETTSEFIYNFEALHYSRCITIPDSRVIKVTEKEIIEISKIGDKYRFEPKKCTPLIKQ
jgi:hypothetical protein